MLSALICVCLLSVMYRGIHSHLEVLCHIQRHSVTCRGDVSHKEMFCHMQRFSS